MLYFFVSRFAIYSWKAEKAQLSYYLGICACLRNFWTTISQVLEDLSCLNSLFSVPAFWSVWVGQLNLLLQEWLNPLKEGLTFATFYCFLLPLCYSVMWTSRKTSDSDCTCLPLLKFWRVENIACHFLEWLSLLLVPSTVILTENSEH